MSPNSTKKKNGEERNCPLKEGERLVKKEVAATDNSLPGKKEIPSLRGDVRGNGCCEGKKRICPEKDINKVGGKNASLLGICAV